MTDTTFKIKELHDSKLVYHYTSQEGMLSILKNKTLWFTDVQFLSDKSELVTVIDAVIKAIEKLKNDTLNETQLKLLSEIESYVEYVEKSGDLFEFYSNKLCEDGQIRDTKGRYYVLCASKASDDLGLWNYYVKNEKYCGYNIGINVEKVKATWDQEIIITGKEVLYDKTEQIDHFYNCIGRYLKDYYSGTTENNIEFGSMEIIGKLGVEIDDKKLFYKAEAFRDEREYRFIIEVDNLIEKDITYKDNIFGDGLTKEYRSGESGVLTPYLVWNWGKQAPDLIEQITLSPMVEVDLAQESISQLFDEYGLPGINIVPSSISKRF